MRVLFVSSVAVITADPEGIEFEVDDVAAAAAELEEKGYELVVPVKTEEWGQTVGRLMSPEGVLVGVTYTPWMRE